MKVYDVIAVLHTSASMVANLHNIEAELLCVFRVDSKFCFVAQKFASNCPKKIFSWRKLYIFCLMYCGVCVCLSMVS